MSNETSSNQNIPFSKTKKNKFLENLYDAYENAVKTWPTTQCPVEKKFFTTALKIIALLYPRNSLFETSGVPNSRTIELSLIANIRAKKRIAAFHDLSEIYGAGYMVPTIASEMIIIGLSHI